tara:strand:+ start:342 stop:710 length:369 start_codon:yes stop_codon:yes gene_type:complete
MKKFLRRTWDRYSKLGKGRKKLQKWRKPTGRDNKMREKMKGHPKVVSIGYKKSEKVRKATKSNQIFIKNIRELEGIEKNQTVFVGHVGKKRKIELAKKAKEKGISLQNLNTKKVLKELKNKK